MYERYPINARLAYRYQGKALCRLGSEPALDRYVDDRSQLDFSLQYAVSGNVGIFCEAFNLTNEPFRIYQGSENIHKQTELQGRQYGVGIRFQF